MNWKTRLVILVILIGLFTWGSNDDVNQSSFSDAGAEETIASEEEFPEKTREEKICSEEQLEEIIVTITNTGSKYHR